MMIRRHKPIRAFEATSPIEIYRVAGRRPSTVWVDNAGQIGAAGPDTQPLKELVFWRTQTQPGEQIQEHVGGMFLVTVKGDCHPITLSAPAPLTAQTAFASAQARRDADEARIEALIAAGSLVEVEGRRPKGNSSRPGDRLVPATHALVVEERPSGIDTMPTMPARAMGAQRRWQ